MLSKELELTLNQAFQEAREKRHEFMTVEHLLLALLENPSATSVLIACGAEIESLKKELSAFIDETTPLIPPMDSERETQPTIGFQRVLQRAVFQVQSSGKKEVTGASVIVAIFSEQDSQAVYFLKQQCVARIDVVNYLSHGITKREEPDRESLEHFDDEDGPVQSQSNPLERYTTNLNELARKNLIDPLVGRQEEIERTVQVLCRRKKNNPIFVGEAGVGKTALAEGLALKIIGGQVPDILKDAVIYALDLGALLAGTKYRGDFEKRFKTLVNDLISESKAILFIDEIHSIIGAGAASGGVMDASNLLKPLLSTGTVRCMGSTTYDEYRGIFEKDHALSRRFQKIDVPEPSNKESFEILRGLKERYENYHGVRFTQQALKAAVELSAKHLHDKFLPDKAIDVIDEAAAKQHLMPISKRKRTIGVHDIEAVIAKMARIPEKSVSNSDKDILINLKRNLQLMIYGQDEAIDALSTSIKLARSGLGDEYKPMGSFLLAGPTGVGKTEVTKQLASLLGIELIRFDMSEYMEAHTVSRLIGAPPGYVGFDQGGLLTESIHKHPHCVLLLDEIEKAHSDLFNLLLQVMDHGKLTDTNGRQVSFRNVVLVMTTNSGAEMASRTSMGFMDQDHAPDAMQEIKRLFAPEFRNRLTKIIQFNSLGANVVLRVVDKFLVELDTQLEARKVEMTITDEAKAWFAEHGFDKKMGARPMQRLIEEKLKTPIADELLFGNLAQGGSVHISVVDGELHLKSRAKVKSEA